MRLALYLSAFVVSGSLMTACGGGDDAAGSDGGTVTGEHTQYVFNSLVLPKTTAEAADLGLNLDDTPLADNALGGLLGTIQDGVGLDLSGNVDTAIADGTLLLLTDLQTDSLSDSSAAAMSVYLGKDPTPAPCADEADVTCGKHLTGSGSFSLADNSPTDAILRGAITDSVFEGGPGSVTIALPLSAAAAPIELDLKGTRMKVTVAKDGLMSGIIGGGITTEDINTKVLPAVAGLCNAILANATDCPNSADNDPSTPCCTAGTTGATIAMLFDLPEVKGDMYGDCNVTADEVKAQPLIGSPLTSPDLDLDSEVAGKDALSIGVGFTAVKGSFTRP